MLAEFEALVAANDLPLGVVVEPVVGLGANERVACLRFDPTLDGVEVVALLRLEGEEPWGWCWAAGEEVAADVAALMEVERAEGEVRIAGMVE